MDTIYIVALVLIVAFFGMIVYSHYKTKNTPEVKKSENIKLLNAKNFKMQTQRGLVLVDFWAAWCAPCKMLTPVLNDIADDVSNDLTVGKLNVEQFQQVASKHKIKSLPTLVLFKDGVEVKRILGVKNKKAIMKEIAQYA
ncbi:MAG: thioredoxin [Salinivirgaceae bacterium]|jgi:thioredoxin 1|nr:thioredoxin [Salinivirgaceae bacterium]